ncbi:hypothetical protein B0A55_08532 [Friedmanniomyces simplex]|uniref:Phytanoyl-CoA dioxygenase n=1 Tax=Friedmanniomyces simplex TaxID=329884 RepID=A0A4U0X5L6_9PEZI|nr:hypothetical protein B0A55_08532 [Friedmanniomyces simplex]
MPPSTSGRNTAAIAAAATAASIASIASLLYYLEIPSLLQQRVQARTVGGPRCYSPNAKPSLPEFKLLTQQETLRETYPLASRIEKNTPIYDCASFDLTDVSATDKLQDELYHNLTSGPGVYILKHFFLDPSIIDATNQAFEEIIAYEHQASGGAKGDHFAPGNANARIWNAFSKHALQDPESYVQYFSNPWFKLVCDSYLGPGYKITTQVNIVRPGGKAQMPHRDYHLGFQTDEDVVAWPKAVHQMSGLLTLQGAVAHTDMPLESGPTRLMPYSQTFGEGFRSYRRPEFIEYFESNHVSVALEKGDAVFFSPSLFHAAGENITADFDRSANLIQVSSAFGKTMETIDTLPLIDKTYDLLAAKYRAEGLSMEVDALIRAVAEGYPFPTNLDCRPPAPGGMAPESEQQILRRGIIEGWDRERMMSELDDMREASSANGKIGRQTTVFGT